MHPTVTSAVRDQTRVGLYRLIASQEGITRSALVEMTGLSRSAINQSVARLIADGMVTQTEAEVKGRGTGSGRPSIRLRAVSTGHHVAAVDFGHDHVFVAIADMLGELLDVERTSIDVDLRAEDAMDLAMVLMEGLRERNGISRLASVVAGIPGPVDASSGRVQSPTILSSWVGLVPADELARRIGMPVHVENDAVLGAFGELRQGSGKHYKNFLYVKASNGIGAGLVTNGEPYRGATGLAGEIGHTRLPGRSELCRCGNAGCLEAAISTASIRARIIHTHPSQDPATITLSGPGDPIVHRILADAGLALGGVLADLCNLLNPEAVIIGGELGTAGPALIEGIRSAIDRVAQPATAAVVEVLPAALGTDAELVGAIQFAAHLARA